MKKTLLIPALVCLAPALFAADTEPKSSPAPNASASVTGKATVTIDVNGQKQTREIDLGKFNGPTTITGGTLNISGTTIKGATLELTGNTLNMSGRRTWLGVAPEEVSNEVRAQLPLEDGTGLLVRYVAPGSPAETAGLLQNDVLTKFDDQILINAAQLRVLLGTKKEGDVVHLTYLRRGQQATMEAKLAMHEAADANAAEGGESSPLGKGWLGKLLGQVVSGAVVADKDGKVITSDVQIDMSETAKQVEKSLRDAGVDEKVIEQAKKAFADKAASIQKALKDAGASTGPASRGDW